MWKHETKYKGKVFLGGYEFSKKLGKRVLRFKNAYDGKEVGEYTTPKKAKADGWIKFK